MEMQHSTERMSELRIRVVIDSDMPELLSRLGPFKRPAREALHLLRLGIAYERVLGQQAPPHAISEKVDIKPGPGPLVSELEVDSRKAGKAMETGFVNTTGLDASYFDPPPR